MTVTEVKRGLLLKMQEAFPKETYKYYAMEVKEGFTRPSFFTQLKPVSMEPCNYNSRSNQAAFYITYFQKTIDEAEALDRKKHCRNHGRRWMDGSHRTQNRCTGDKKR